MLISNLLFRCHPLGPAAIREVIGAGTGTFATVDEPTVIQPRGGEVIGDSAERRVEILSDGDAVHATWSRFGPGREGADPHIHRHHTDLFYVLEGELTVRLGLEDEAVVVPQGALARVPPLVVHGFRNGSDAELRYLNFHAPGVGFADYMRGLRDGRSVTYDQEPPPGEGLRPASEAVIGAPGLGVHVDIDAIRIEEVRGEPGDAPRSEPQSLYVLEGELVLTAGDRELRAPTGSWVDVPPGVPHTLTFPGPEPVRYLAITAAAAG
jgi:mannose-6-phosphate isomerase-like protein (cupin superfamily)